jgi:hypothetical protein
MSTWNFKLELLFNNILDVLLSDSSKKIFDIKYYGDDFTLNARIR